MKELCSCDVHRIKSIAIYAQGSQTLESEVSLVSVGVAHTNT